MIRNKIILDLLVQKAKKDFKKVLEAEKLDGGLSFVLTLGDIPPKDRVRMQANKSRL